MSLDSWKGRTIYFVMLDRFQNGDKSNDDFGQGEYSATDDDCFQGGDLKGLTAKLPYIRRMGFDALWITPPVHNQWINPAIRTRGYHGYWTYDFTRIDPHFGGLEDYKRMVARAHELGIRVIQDIVVNHTGNYFTVAEEGYDPAHPELHWKPVGAHPPARAPQAPNDPVFRMNNPNDPEHKRAGVYNFTPNITDFRDRAQTLTRAMGDLDDIDLLNPLAAERMKEIYRYWIEQAGVDGFRVDTVYYTPETFYDGFLYDEDPQRPGIKPFAKRKGIEDFLVFGEVWSYDYKAIGRYLRRGKKPRLDSAVDLPLNEALTQVFYRKAPTEVLRSALAAKRSNAPLWVNFLDNHDVERMHARAAWPAVKQSLTALFALPGLPCVYYGTEAGFTAARQNMFAPKNFDEKSSASRHLRALIRLRKRHPALTDGKVSVQAASFAEGAIAWEVAGADASYLCAFNTSPDRAILAVDGLRRGFEVVFASHPADFRGRALVLPPESYLVLRRKPAQVEKVSSVPSIRLHSLRGKVLRDEFSMNFDLRRPERATEVALVCDGNYDRRLRIPDPRTGRFRLSARELGNGRHRLRLMAREKSGGLTLSAEQEVLVRNPYRTLVKVDVPETHKGGPGNRIRPPAEPSYAGQLSMRSVKASTSGRDLRLEIAMASVTKDWNPPHGYDHVYFHVFFDFPGRRGKRFLPKLGFAPDDFDFSAGFLLYGWGSRSFAARDSTPDRYGSPLVGEVEQSADVARKTVRFTFSDRLFDGLRTLAGAQVFISTWDGYLGDLRAVAGKAEDWSFSVVDGGTLEVPKIYDHIRLTL